MTFLKKLRKKRNNRKEILRYILYYFQKLNN